MNIEIRSLEAKTKLPELLRGIRAGNRYTITLRGERVAYLVPVEDASADFLLRGSRAGGATLVSG